MNYEIVYSNTGDDESMKIALEKIKTKYLKHIDWLTVNNANEQTINEFYKLIKFIDQTDNSGYLDAFKIHTTQVDKIRNENLLTVFPELSELFE